MDVNKMTMAQYIQMQADKRKHVEYVEPIGQLQEALDAKNELYRQLYMCQAELRATEAAYKLYVDKTIELAQRLGCIPHMDIWKSIEQEFNRIKENKNE